MTVGRTATGFMHACRKDTISHHLIGSLYVDVGFSTGGHLARNLLGRDFFSRVQVGFRESRLTLYIAAQP